MTLESFYRSKEHADYFSTARVEILPLVPQIPGRVLDLGSGEGATLRLLKDRGLATWTCGVDISESALQRAQAAGVDMVVCGSLDDVVIPLEPGSLDLILCLDVLEHLVNPWATLRRVTALLKTGGILIASIPNVQTLRVLAPLLVGRWEYRDCGILDEGHLRFFTRRSAIRLVEQAGLSVTSVTPLTEPHWLPRLCDMLTLRLAQRLITVQFLIRAIR